MKVNTPDLDPTLHKLENAQAEKGQAVEHAQGIVQNHAALAVDALEKAAATQVQGTSIDVGAPPPAPFVPPHNPGGASSTFAENLDTVIGSAGSSPFTNPTADNLARAFLAQQIFTDRQDAEAQEQLSVAASQLTKLAIANAKKEIERLQAEIKAAEKSSGGMFGGGGFMGKIMMILNPIGYMMMQMMKDKAGGKVEALKEKLDNAHKRLSSLVDNLMAMTKHLRQMQEAQLQAGADQIKKETVEVGPDGLPKGLQDKMKSALSEGIVELSGQDNLTVDQAVNFLTEKTVAVLGEHGVTVDEGFKAQLASTIRQDLFDETPAEVDAVSAGVAAVQAFSARAEQKAAAPRTVIG